MLGRMSTHIGKLFMIRILMTEENTFAEIVDTPFLSVHILNFVGLTTARIVEQKWTKVKTMIEVYIWIGVWVVILIMLIISLMETENRIAEDRINKMFEYLKKRERENDDGKEIR